MSIIEYLKEGLLCEGLGTVFHATELPEAVKIVNSGCFELSPVIGSDVEIELSKGKYYYLSTMRTITGRYMKTPDKGSSVKKNVFFELDDDALSHNLKKTPVDYWRGDPNMSESEERYLSDDDTLCNIDKYVKGIHVLIDEDGYMMKEYPKKYLTQLYELNVNSPVPVYYYTDQNKYLTRRGGMTIDEYLKSKGIDNVYDSIDFDSMNRPHKSNHIDEIISFYNDPKISSEVYKELDKYLSSSTLYVKDFVTDLKNTIHSARRSGGMKGDTSNKTVKDLINIMKKSKSKNIDDFIYDVFIPDVYNKFNWNKDNLKFLKKGM